MDIRIIFSFLAQHISYFKNFQYFVLFIVREVNLLFQCLFSCVFVILGFLCPNGFLITYGVDISISFFIFLSTPGSLTKSEKSGKDKLYRLSLLRLTMVICSAQIRNRKVKKNEKFLVSFQTYHQICHQIVFIDVWHSLSDFSLPFLMRFMLIYLFTYSYSLQIYPLLIY